MRDIVKEYQKKFRRNHQRARRYTALLLALALTTSLFVNWQLHGVGIAKTAEYLCGELEHEHTAACYEKQLVCGYEEGEPEDWNATMTDDDMSFDDTFDMDDDAFGVDADDPGIAAHSAEPEYIFVPHEHTDDCYQEVQELTCLEEEHTHDDSCFDEDGVTFICDKFEHTHDDSCYTTTYELVCGLEEGELVEEVNPDYDPVALFEEPVAAKPVVVDPVIETPVHHHTDACYEEVLVCGLPEHHHTVNCLSDPLDDTQDEDEWLAQTGTTLSGNWADDLLAVAESQLGYEQSERNFQLDDADGKTVRHYTRYGNDYGNDYGPWDVMFLSYCLKYADIPQSAIPQVSSVLSLHSQLRSALYNEETGSGYAMDFDGDLPSDAAMPGVVSAVDPDAGTLTVISGDVDGKVAKVTLNASQVTTLVSVANAQQADYGVATLDFKVKDDEGNITTIKGLDALNYLTALKVQRKNGTEYEDTNVTTISELLHSSLTVADIPAKAIQGNDYCVHVKLPKSFDVLNDELISGKLEDTGNYDACGSYRLLKGNDGCWYAVLRYDQNYIKQKEAEDAGADTSDAKVTSNVSFNFQWNQSEVTSSGFNQIEVKKDYTLDITINPDKTPDEDQKDDKNYDLNQSVTDPRHDGSDAYLDYTVTLVVQNEQAGPLTLADSMTLPTGVTAEYVEDSLQLSMENGNTTLGITWENVNDERKITLGSAGSPIAAGTYSIRYTVKLKDVGETAVDGEVINNIKILDTPISDDAEKSVKTDSLVITSQADPSDYELPSTGGAGTKLYTAGGGALMLAALVCGVCRKRRRERRAR